MRWWCAEVKIGAFYLIPRYAATIILYCLVSVLWLSKSTTRINLLLPSSGIVDDVLDNKGTLKFSTRTCWPRVQWDPFLPSVLHIYHWYKKQFSKDKRLSGSVKIIRRQTIQHTWHMTESFIIHERAIEFILTMARTTASTALTHLKHIMHKCIQILMKVAVKEGVGGGGGLIWTLRRQAGPAWPRKQLFSALWASVWPNN